MSVFVIIVVAVVVILIVRGVLRNVAEKNEEKSRAYYNSAKEHERNGNYEQAITDFNKFFELNKDPYYTNYMERGNLCNVTANFDLAITDYTRVINLGKKSVKIQENAYGADASTGSDLCNIAKAYDLRGDVYDKKGDRKQAVENYSEAVFYFDKTIEAAPYGAEYYAMRGDVYEKLGHDDKKLENYNQAIWTCDRFLQQDRNSFSQLYLRGKYYENLGDIEHTISDFEAIMQFQLDKDGFEDFEDYNYAVKSLSDLQKKVIKELDAIKNS